MSFHKPTQAEEDLIDQIYTNMRNRGIIDWDEQNEGLQKSELYILMFHLKKLIYQEISDLLLQKSIDYEKLAELNKNQ